MPVGGFSKISIASLWIAGPGGRCREPSCAPSCAPAWRAYGRLAQEVACQLPAVPPAVPPARWPEQLCSQRDENIRDTPTQAVENIIPLQKTPDMLCYRAAADTEMTLRSVSQRLNLNFTQCPKTELLGVVLQRCNLSSRKSRTLKPLNAR